MKMIQDTYAVFKKKPPKSRNGIITAGPMERAIDIPLLMHDIK
jgi:hypothetical protein